MIVFEEKLRRVVAQKANLSPRIEVLISGKIAIIVMKSAGMNTEKNAVEAQPLKLL